MISFDLLARQEMVLSSFGTSVNHEIQQQLEGVLTLEPVPAHLADMLEIFTHLLCSLENPILLQVDTIKLFAFLTFEQECA